MQILICDGNLNMCEAKVYLDMLYQCPNIKHKISTLYTQVMTYIIMTLNSQRASHITLHRAQIQDRLRTDVPRDSFT